MTDLDRTIQSLYTASVEDDWQSFRGHALEIVCTWAGASGGAWHTRSASALPGEFTEYPAGTGLTREPLLSLEFPPGARELELSPLPASLARGKDEDGYAIRYSHRGGGELISTVLLRFPRGVERKQSREELNRGVGHMVEAGTLALHHFIQRDDWLHALGRPNRGTAALLDDHGAIYVAARRFRQLIAEEYGDPNFSVLPCAIPQEALDTNGCFEQGPLHFRISRQGSLFVIYARRRQPLDGLSPREQEIARALGNGKTFKSVARQYGIAVSTVANHASRIYKKLGIFRREELVELVRAPVQNTPQKDAA